MWGTHTGNLTSTSTPAMAEAPFQYRFQSAQGEDVYTSQWIHHVTISPLKTSTRYYYKVGGAAGWSSELSFTTLPAVGKETPLTLALIGDLGQTENSSMTVQHIAEGMASKGIQMTWLVGDLSYADSEHATKCWKASGCTPKRWDTWGRMVQQIAAAAPLMTCPGNHEIEYDPKPLIGTPFMQYDHRMRMPLGGYLSQYWSMEVGGAHLISLNSYTDFTVGSPQYEWLLKDLASVDRTRTPWLIVGLHAPWYNSNTHHHDEKEETGMRQVLEPVFHKYEVDLLFCGHVHAYERMHPVLNNKTTPGAMTEINIGDGGNREVLEEDPLDWIFPQPEWSAFRKNEFGHGVLRIVNSTNAEWTWHTIHTAESVVSDFVAFVKTPGQRGVVTVELQH
eukprot:Sspe_Gene.35491::Locus_17189_Transcript_1_1_Confidence_1.000_Length_2057::g.35491::m.35491